ncbi:hypothetical protein D3C71_1726590 [compost metagenome]
MDGWGDACLEKGGAPRWGEGCCVWVQEEGIERWRCRNEIAGAKMHDAYRSFVDS